MVNRGAGIIFNTRGFWGVWGVWGLWVNPHYTHTTHYPHSAAVGWNKRKIARVLFLIPVGCFRKGAKG